MIAGQLPVQVLCQVWWQIRECLVTDVGNCFLRILSCKHHFGQLVERVIDAGTCFSACFGK